MVRILKVKELQDKKRELLARSEIHRQTLALEVSNVKMSLTLLKKRLRILKTAYRLLGIAVPIGGLLFGHKEPDRKKGFLSKLLSGLNVFSRVRSFFNGAKTGHAPEPEAEDFPSSRLP
jgi:hypothetical protein